MPDTDDDDEALLCDLLICQDIDDNDHLQDASNLAWRFDVEVPVDEAPVQVCEDQLEELIYLATNAKKQRTEVKLSTLTDSELLEFEKAKRAEVDTGLRPGQCAGS